MRWLFEPKTSNMQENYIRIVCCSTDPMLFFCGLTRKTLKRKDLVYEQLQHHCKYSPENSWKASKHYREIQAEIPWHDYYIHAALLCSGRVTFFYRFDRMIMHLDIWGSCVDERARWWSALFVLLWMPQSEPNYTERARRKPAKVSPHSHTTCGDTTARTTKPRLKFPYTSYLTRKPHSTRRANAIWENPSYAISASSVYLCFLLNRLFCCCC